MAVRIMSEPTVRLGPVTITIGHADAVLLTELLCAFHRGNYRLNKDGIFLNITDFQDHAATMASMNSLWHHLSFDAGLGKS